MPNSIFKKLAEAREEFHSLKIEKTGWNPHSKFKFFELGDFLIPAMSVLKKHGLIPIVSFRDDYAVMDLRETEGDGSFEILSPMVTAEYSKEIPDRDGNAGSIYVEQGASLPGCHPIQNLGAVETYQRRYLWVTLMEIVEHDALDATVGDEPKESPPKTTPAAPKKTEPKKAAAKKTTPKKAEADPHMETVITSEDEAGAFVDGCILFVRKHETLKGLVSFWNNNSEQIEILKNDYPTEYERLKTAFTTAKGKLS